MLDWIVTNTQNPPLNTHVLVLKDEYDQWPVLAKLIKRGKRFWWVIKVESGECIFQLRWFSIWTEFNFPRQRKKRLTRLINNA